MDNTNQTLINLIQGKKIQVVLREVSNQGNTRCIDFLVIEGDRLRSVSYLMAQVLGLKQSKKYFGLVVHGCGMDMAYACLYRLFDNLGLNTSDVSYSVV